MSRESNPSMSARAKIHLYSLDLVSESGESSVTSPPGTTGLSHSHQLFLGLFTNSFEFKKKNNNIYNTFFPKTKNH